MGACTACRAAKVKCDQSFPCKRCERLGKTCIPHESKQGQNPARLHNKRKLDDCPCPVGTAEELKFECAILKKSTGMVRKDHYALKHLVRKWIAMSLKRRSFTLWSRAGSLAVACGMSMDEVLCEMNEEQRGMDFLHQLITTPSADQTLIAKTPLTAQDIPEKLWKAVGMPTSPESMEQALQSRCFYVMEVNKGVLRYYVSPAFVENVGINLQTIEETYRANNVEVMQLFHAKPKGPKEQHYMVSFAQQLALHSKPDIRPKPTKVKNVRIMVGDDKKEVIVDQLVCLYVPKLDVSYNLTEYIIDTNDTLLMTKKKTGAHPTVSINNNDINPQAEASYEAPPLTDLPDFYLDLNSVEGGDDDFKTILDLLQQS
ncbi:expressed unknown protein [Seminavis robusta]|uniref:Zn(2)-C6 fungal-type domain-containing protein n=1 Tax=Seminavis robusta TaxID=568900 RepID=A0A9N8ED95_9STRA|nr:expressed unknown protein [Seminavis robusta]|eukprot:Sro1008_g230580.1 n/a (372) ;mRNA; f:26637-27752